MTIELPNLGDLLVKRERRGILFALSIIVVLGIGGLLQSLAFRYLTLYMAMVAVAIVIGVATLSRSRSICCRSKVKTERDAVSNDEFRRTNMDRAGRYSFIAAMLTMSLYAVTSLYLPQTILPAQIIAMFVVFGIIVFLGMFLVLDREG